ncbi:MAG: outer membrane lipoprotein-sorting protein [Chitinophagales bacterium]
MKTIAKSLFVLAFVLAFVLFTVTSLQAQDAKAIVKKAVELQQGVSSSYGEMAMTIVRPDYTRTMTMKSWSKGDNNSLILVTSPVRDKGTAFLKRDKEMWNWQPTIERVIKMPPSMMSQSWMGSDFTNDDLVRQSSTVDDFSHKLLGTETIEGREAYKIELIPNEDAVVVWGKMMMWIDTEAYIQLKVEFYDEDAYLVNTIYGKNIKKMGGKMVASIMEVVPAEEEGNKTVIEYKVLEFEKPIKESFFSVQSMKRVR